jgi:nitrite reductase/ring-hydroxylating ferredoxin subunit
MPNIRVSLHDIPSGTPLRVTSGDVAIVVLRSHGQISAFEDVCPHAFWPLSSGEVEDDVLVCPGHGWEFKLDTGQCRNAPAYCLQTVPLTIEGDTVVLQCDGLQPRKLRPLAHKVAFQPAT